MKIVSFALITVLATAFAAVIGSSPLLAQTAGTPQPSAQMSPPTHPGPNQWARDRDWYGPPGGTGYGWMGPGMMGPQHGWMMGQGHGWQGRHGWQRWHRRPRGARFTFMRGNARVDIQCPADQSLKDCVDAASTLIDKVVGMGPPPPPPPGAPKPPAAAPGSGN